MQNLSLDTVGWIIVKARELDVKDVDTGEEDATEDDLMGVLEDRPNDPTALELKSWIDDLNDDAQAELVALFWLGRDDGDAEEFEGLVEEARRRHTGSTSAYLLGSPLLADYLDAGISILGYEASDIEPKF